MVADAPLIFTGQIWPEFHHELGRPLQEQAQSVLKSLKKELQLRGVPLKNVVKLNIQISHASAREGVEKVLAKAFSEGSYPAVTFTISGNPQNIFDIGLDATAVRPGSRGTFNQIMAPAVPVTGERLSAELPKGPKLFVSGMADTNELPLAAIKTMEKLEGVLEYFNGTRDDIVQLRIFLDSTSQLAAVRKSLIQFFQSNAPPMVFIEWISPKPNPPIEIELVARADERFLSEKETVQFITPPGTTSTKTFSRVARVNHGHMIFFSEFTGPAKADGGAQVRALYGRMREIANLAGSDFEHLVKAVYYVTDDDGSNKLNELRLEYYDPKKPPAASKAKVAQISAPGRTVIVDMIAVQKE